jgi:mannose-6-phosphate isomerase class I
MYAKEHKEELRIKNQERYYKDRENRLTYAKKRHRTKRGFLLNAYSNAKGRVTGRKLRSAIKQGNPVGSLEQYVGLPIMEKEEFLNWATKDKMFNKIFEEWEKGGYKLVDSPSIDRLNTQDGYVMGNIFFSTHSENSRAGSISRWQQ